MEPAGPSSSGSTLRSPAAGAAEPGHPGEEEAGARIPCTAEAPPLVLERSEQWPCTLEDLWEAGGKNWPLNRIVDSSGETHHTAT